MDHSGNGREWVVKWLSRNADPAGCAGWAAQCPGGRPVWGNCRFVFDLRADRYDWLVAVDDLPRFSRHSLRRPEAAWDVACPRGRTILTTTEPSSVARYGRAFAAQFGHVLTSQEAWALPHPHRIHSQTGNIWFYGKSYDQAKAELPPEKPFLLSTVCSSKQQGHTVHAKRYAFTQRLKQVMPGLEIFGHGVRYVAHKYETLDPFAFHLAIENHVAPHHWTEKLADAFLGYTVPFYYGCPNVFDYFPEESVIPIDIEDFEGALRTIRSSLTMDEYRRRLPAVIEARRRVLERYNLPGMIHDIVNAHAADDVTVSDAPLAFRNRFQMRALSPGDLLRFAAWRIGNQVQSLWVNGGKRT